MSEQLPAPESIPAEAGQQLGRDVTQESRCQRRNWPQDC